MSDMQVFVPFNPTEVIPENRRDAVRFHAEIRYDELKPFLCAWEKRRMVVQEMGYDRNPLKNLATVFAPEIWYNPFGETTLARFLVRPGLTVYACSKEGNNPLYAKHAFALGQEIARAGYNLYYGGGNSGLMGHAKDGYIQARNALNGKFSDQYAIQVFPACFTSYCEVLDANGLKPSNEGLKNTADAAIITTCGLPNRGAGLQHYSDGAFSMPGGLGSTSEISSDLLLAKTGRRDCPLVLLSTDGFYQSFQQHAENIVKNGLDSPSTANLLHLAPDPKAAITIMNGLLKRRGFDIEAIYQQRQAAMIQHFGEHVFERANPDRPYVTRTFAESGIGKEQPGGAG